MSEGTAFALRFARLADCATVVDNQVGEVKPILLGNDTHQLLLNLHRVPAGGPAKAAGQANIMRIDSKTFHDPKSVAQDDIGGFACHAIQAQQPLHRARYFPAEISDDFLRGCADISGLIAIEAGLANILFQFALAGRSVILRRAIFAEEFLMSPARSSR